MTATTRRRHRGRRGITCPLCSRTELRLPTHPGFATPLASLTVLAVDSGVDLSDLPEPAAQTGFAGAVAAWRTPDGYSGLLMLAPDLDNGLRADVLAFGLALLDKPEQVVAAPRGRVGIRLERLPAAPKGNGHVAWHVAARCGRRTESATFEFVPLYAKEESA